jgi:hypothetical protein
MWRRRRDDQPRRLRSQHRVERLPGHAGARRIDDHRLDHPTARAALDRARVAGRDPFDRAFDGRDLRARGGAVCVQVVGGDLVAFDRDDPGAAQHGGSHRKQARAGIQIEQRRADRNALDHVRDEILQQVAIA